MWTRKLSASMMDQEDFVQAFVRALSNDAVINKLQHAVCGQLQKEVGELREILKNREKKIVDLEAKVSQLEQKQDNYEQYSRRNNIRINGIEQSDSENLDEKVLELFNDTMKVTPPVTLQQIDRVHRVGPQKDGVPRSVLVKFATYRAGDSVYRRKKNLKQVNQERNQTSQEQDTQTVNQQSASRTKPKIFINEDLTKLRSNLLWAARMKKKDGKLQDCWTWDGSVLIKNNVARIIPIQTHADLENEAP